jgi:hypothetical protein
MMFDESERPRGCARWPAGPRVPMYHFACQYSVPCLRPGEDLRLRVLSCDGVGATRGEGLGRAGTATGSASPERFLMKA